MLGIWQTTYFTSFVNVSKAYANCVFWRIIKKNGAHRGVMKNFSSSALWTCRSTDRFQCMPSYRTIVPQKTTAGVFTFFVTSRKIETQLYKKFLYVRNTCVFYNISTVERKTSKTRNRKNSIPIFVKSDMMSKFMKQCVSALPSKIYTTNFFTYYVTINHCRPQMCLLIVIWL